MVVDSLDCGTNAGHVEDHKGLGKCQPSTFREHQIRQTFQIPHIFVEHQNMSICLDKYSDGSFEFFLNMKSEGHLRDLFYVY